MNKQILCAAALFAAIGAQAQTKEVGGFVGIGITGGGESLAHVTYSNGETKDIKSGGLVDFKLGVHFRRQGAPWSLQASLGYHTDRTAATNGNIKFTRFPIEALGFYHVNEQFRVGGGLRYAASPKLSGSGAAAGLGNHDLSASAGFVAEGEYLFSPQFGVTVRGVAEKYKFKNGPKVEGNHFGVRFNYYF